MKDDQQETIVLQQNSIGELGLNRKKIHIKLKFCTELEEVTM